MPKIVTPDINPVERLEGSSLVGLLNTAANRGDNLQEILEILSSETQRILSGRGTAVCLLSQDKQYLTADNLNLNKRLRDRIEQLAGTRLSGMRIRLTKDGIYREVLEAAKPFLTNSPQTIQRLMTEFTENRVLQMLVPTFYQMLSIRSVMVIPLVSDGECFGLIETSRGRPFTEADLRLFETISGQITLAIKRKQLEDAFRESETRYRNLFESMAQGAVYHDAQGKVISANLAALKILGLPFEVLSRRSLLDSSWKGIRESGSAFPVEEHPAVVALRTGKEVKNVVLGSFNPAEQKYRWICVSAVPQFRPQDHGKPYQVFTTFDDVTQSKETEKMLRQSEQFNISLLENSLHPIMVLDPDDSVRYVNPAFAKLTGFLSTEMVGTKPPFKYWPKDEWQQYSLDYKNPNISRCERIFQKKNAEKFWVDLSVNPVTEEGKLKYYLINWVDITERKKAEAARQEIYAFKASILENAPNSIIIRNPDNSIRYVNPAFEKLSGFTLDELVNKQPPYPYWPEERAKHYLQGLIESFPRETGPKIVERYFQKKSGELFLVELTNNAVRDDGGNLLYHISIWVDETQRKKAEGALIASEEKYRSLVNNVKLGIARSTAEAGGRFLEVNKAVEDITGYTRDELLNMPVADIYVDSPQRSLIMDQIILGKDKTAREIRLKRKDGNHIVVAVTLTPVKDSDGKTVYLDGILEDITQRKSLELALKDLYEKEKNTRRELEEEAKARIRFIDVLAHEMKGPLTPMIASSGMLQDLLLTNSDNNLKKLSDNISAGANVLLNRLDELLEVARFARGNLKLNLVVTDIYKFLNEVVSRYAFSLVAHDQHLISELSPDLPATPIDSSRLEQVIINLLSNASKYSPPDSQILLTAINRQDAILVSVKDQGVGISSEDQARLFKPYQRLGQDQSKTQGLGLGLTVVKHIVEAHGGNIWVTSEPGQGSTFSFTVPLKQGRIAN